MRNFNLSEAERGLRVGGDFDGHSTRFPQILLSMRFIALWRGANDSLAQQNKHFRWLCHPFTLRRKRLQHQSINLLLNGAFHGGKQKATTPSNTHSQEKWTQRRNFFVVFSRSIKQFLRLSWKKARLSGTPATAPKPFLPAPRFQF